MIGLRLKHRYLNQLAEIGTKKHEEHRLLNLFRKPEPYDTSSDKTTDNEELVTSFIDSKNEDFFNDIRNSELKFSGHSKGNRVSYFINEEKRFIGQPNYIFKNKKVQLFVVEEKFKRNNESNQQFFFRNHKVQLAAYIYYLNQFKCEYGYLVYWLYDYYNYSYSIVACRVLKVIRTI